MAGPVCLSSSAEASAILQAHHWTPQYQQVSNYYSLVILSDLCNILRLQLASSHTFLSGNHTADELARQSALLQASTAFLVSPILFFASTHLTLWTRGLLPQQNHSTYTPFGFIKDLVLLGSARCVFSATDIAFFLDFHLTTIGKIKNLLYSVSCHSFLNIFRLILPFLLQTPYVARI